MGLSPGRNAQEGPARRADRLYPHVRPEKGVSSVADGSACCDGQEGGRATPREDFAPETERRSSEESGPGGREPWRRYRERNRPDRGSRDTKNRDPVPTPAFAASRRPGCPDWRSSACTRKT